MQLFDKLSQKAKEHPQRIVLPEGTEPRTLTAANRIIADGLAHIILIGDPKEVLGMAQELKLDHIKYATIVNPADQAVIDRYAPLFFELRKSKGISMEQARLTTANPLYLGCLMVKNGDADGQVAGAMNTTGNVLRAAFQVIKTQPGIDVVSGAFLMLLPEGSPFGTDGILIFADCAVVPDRQKMRTRFGSVRSAVERIWNRIFKCCVRGDLLPGTLVRFKVRNSQKNIPMRSLLFIRHCQRPMRCGPLKNAVISVWLLGQIKGL